MHQLPQSFRISFQIRKSVTTLVEKRRVILRSNRRALIVRMLPNFYARPMQVHSEFARLHFEVTKMFITVTAPGVPKLFHSWIGQVRTC